MASFSMEDSDRLDWELMQDGALKLFYRSSILNPQLQWLTAHGYRVESIDCGDKETFLLQMTSAFQFKENFGYEPWTGNLNALNDAFRQLDFDGRTGLAFCFLEYDTLACVDSGFAQGVLDLVEYHSREYLLLGQRLMGLVQSNDPNLHFQPVGARSVLWNRLEWLDSNRRK